MKTLICLEVNKCHLEYKSEAQSGTGLNWEMEYSPEDDRKHFKTLESDYNWGLYDQACYDEHNLVVGNKFAERGQAEI